MVRNPQSRNRRKPTGKVAGLDGVKLNIVNPDQVKMTVVDKPIHRLPDPVKKAVKGAIKEEKIQTQMANPDDDFGDWDQLHNIHNTAAQAVIESGAQINVIANNHDITKRIENKTLLSKLITSLQKDLEAFAGELAGIGKRLEGKEGPIRGVDAMLLALSIHDDYTTWNERFTAITTPIVQEIIELSDQATRDHLLDARNQMFEAKLDALTEDTEGESMNETKVVN